MSQAPRRARWAWLEAPWLPWIAAAWIAAVGFSVLARPCPLGNDEAQYALGARGLFTADVDAYPLYRSIGMRVLAAPGVYAGGDEALVRLPFVLIAIGYLAVVVDLARRWGGPRAAGLVALLHAGAAPWLVRTTAALSDIPAAAALFAMIALAARDAERARPRLHTWLAIAGLGAAAVYVRYGTAPMVVVVLAAIELVFPRRRAMVAWCGLATLTFLAPFLGWSHARTGSPLGVLSASADAANRAYPGEGLLYYIPRWPWALAGPVMGAVAAIGVWRGAAAWRDRGGAPAARGTRLLAAAAIAQIILLGASAHGEARYVFFATSALAITGAAWIAPRPRTSTITAALALAAALAGAAIAHLRVDRDRRLAVPLTAAARFVAADAGGHRCLVFTGTRPQVAWYAGCRTELVGAVDPPSPELAAGFDRVYLVSAAGAPRQPPDAARLSTPALTWHLRACNQDPRWCVWSSAGH